MQKILENEKNKKRLTRALFIAWAAFFSIFLYVDHFKIDYLPDWTGWRKILNGDDYWRMAIHEPGNTLFAWDLLGGNTIAMYSPDSGQVSTLQVPVEYFEGLYVRDLLWLRQPGSPGLISYDVQKEIWFSHAEAEAFGEDFGWLVTKDGTLMVYGHDFLKEYVDRKWSPNLWTPDEVLWSIYQDDEGTILANTAYNELYALTQEDHWEYLGRLHFGPFKLFTINDESGLRDHDGLFHWDPAVSEIVSEIIGDLSDDELGKDIIKIQYEMYYVFTTKNIWKYQNGEWERTRTPNLIEHINTAVFDEALQRMFIATDRGVYYKDLPL